MFDTSVLDIDSLALYITEGLNGVIDERYAEPEDRIHIKEPSIEAKAVKVTYNGKAQTQSPVVTLYLNGTEVGLIKDTDYTVSYSNNVKAVQNIINIR